VPASQQPGQRYLIVGGRQRPSAWCSSRRVVADLSFSVLMDAFVVLCCGEAKPR